MPRWLASSDMQLLGHRLDYLKRAQRSYPKRMVDSVCDYARAPFPTARHAEGLVERAGTAHCERECHRCCTWAGVAVPVVPSC
jgi:hypothetical protein